jgi:hypothetical protein
VNANVHNSDAYWGTSFIGAFSLVLSLSAYASDDVVPTRADGVIIATYHFKMTQGEGVPVCGAFLDRLNTTKFSDPPYCGIPEKTSVAGFEPLTRVALTSQATVRLVPAIVEYMRNQIVWTPAMAIPDQDKESFEIVSRWANAGNVNAWRYEPRVSISNDDVADNVVMWQEPGCGTASAIGSESSQVVDRAPTFAFILSADNQIIDDAKTAAQLGDPHGLYQPKAVGFVRVGHNGFQPIGRHMGFFKYQGKYYMDSFLDPEATLNLSSRTVAATTLAIANTFVVFARDPDGTHKICEYKMHQTPPESNMPQFR